MKKFYQSLFYKILVIAGCVVAFFYLVKDLFFFEEEFTKNVIIYAIWLLINSLYLLDIYVFQKEKRNDIIMYFVVFMQIMLPIINRNF